MVGDVASLHGAPCPQSSWHSGYPLIVIAGPTAGGKTALALRVAEQFGGEILSCDSVAVYRELDIGSAKPNAEERRRIPHHGLDLLAPEELTTAGDYARFARGALDAIRARGRLPIVAGGTGLYLRALLHGLDPAPPRNEALRERLRGFAARRGGTALHRVLQRLNPGAAAAIHPNDMPKLIRSLEVCLLARRSQTASSLTGREPLQGFSVLSLGLDPPRAALYERINRRAAAMFERGLVEETAGIRAVHGEVRSLQSLGYAQAMAVLEGRQGLAEAVAEAQQGHRHYAKRQLTWFRKDGSIDWLHGFGDDSGIQGEALARVADHLKSLISDVWVPPKPGGEREFP